MESYVHGFFVLKICDLKHDFFLFLAGHDIMKHSELGGVLKKNL